MEAAISAVAGEFLSRFISFLVNKYFYSSHVRLEEKAERLQQLLTRVHTVIEEADGRYIMNSSMLMQLRMLSEAMYRGYHALDTFTYEGIEDRGSNEVCDSSIMPFVIPLKRSRRTTCARKDKVMHHELHGALKNIEIVAANMMEFVVLLGGCDRMLHRPYDAYLYHDNIMFGRHTEKQILLNFLLQDSIPGDEPAVLPIIGGYAVGKKTLVAHVCSNERVRSRFSSVLHLNGDNLFRILEHGSTMLGEILVVVEFVSNVDDKDWQTFHSFVKSMARCSKVIIVGKLQRLTRFGSVKPIFLNTLPYDEFWYLFKILAFGSANPIEHPQLIDIAEEFSKEFHKEGSLGVANSFTDVLRNNLSVQFWLCLLNKGRRVIEKNISAYGVHLNILMEQGHPVDISDFSSQPLHIIPYTAKVPMKNELPKVTLGEILVDPSIRPKGEFSLLSWKSRIPPYKSFAHFAQTNVKDMPEVTPLSGRKRRGVSL
ncbi:uncharacterized protein LOC124668309 [Lolium rigidum]|uniref:uncharacterized protein LOC124668309 n=1 Tax=Lolium rigidum TaxID=89674 RepID=UPI001F5C7862|nr:uncharacterized protein LOC124668309 [Lolium rigidum]